MKHRALGVVFAQAHSTVIPGHEKSTFPKALVAWRLNLGMKVLPPCGHFL